MAIATAAGFGMAIIASEHLFSTFLSSPWTTSKFAESEEDKEIVRRMYMYAAVLSLISAGIISYILKQWWPLVATIVLCGIYITVYERALRGEL